MHFMAEKESRKYSGFAMYSEFKANVFEREGVPFLSKMVFNRLRGQTSGRSLLV